MLTPEGYTVVVAALVRYFLSAMTGVGSRWGVVGFGLNRAAIYHAPPTVPTVSRVLLERWQDSQRCIHSLVSIGGFTYSSRLVLMAGYVHTTFIG